jgi:hypothetical protein
LILDNLIENFKDKVYIRKKLFLGNRIFYENKTRGVLAKNSKKKQEKQEDKIPLMSAGKP